ncbi:hypothetical protein ABZZ17_38060 [Streptomyces sp. NPDC006512]
MRDVASGVQGENVSDSPAREHWMEIAYIRGASGREFTTAVRNIESTG